MQRPSILLLAAADLAAVAAVVALVATGSVGPLSLTPEQAHLNLLGWASVAAIWLAHARLPVLIENRAATIAQAVLSGGAALGFPGAIAIAEAGDGRALTALTLVWIAGAVLFLARLMRLALGQRAPAAA
ncbi:hypothetical protein [Elioraea sp.]|uniref:hypothetical protein n=1 Tax=Elioraea sp. TaxID=2185103 RepID=UPI0025C4EE6D|nr:hypothetical protein [Elioraea sp.]